MCAIESIYEPSVAGCISRSAAPLVFRFRGMLMKVFSLFLLVSGWFVVLSAIALPKPQFVPAFSVAGLGVELLGLALLARSHVVPRRGAAGRQEHRY